MIEGPLGPAFLIPLVGLRDGPHNHNGPQIRRKKQVGAANAQAPGAQMGGIATQGILALETG